MGESGWMRSRKTPRAEDERAAALVRAAARGNSMEKLLEHSAEVLLSMAGADRAGLYLTGEHSWESGTGRVVAATSGPVPETWMRLDITAPFLRAVLDRSEPFEIDLDPERPIPPLSPLMGMRNALWIPLHAHSVTVGLAVAAYSRSHPRPDLDLLREWADEIALAIAFERDLRCRKLAAEEFGSRLRLSRAIVRGVAADSILAQIARAACHFLSAEFVVLGRAGSSPELAEAWTGRESWRELFEQEAFRRTWTRVLDECREVEIRDKSVLDILNAQSTETSPAIERIVGLPIEGRNRTHGVLMAGLRTSGDRDDDSVRLEAYALLASTAIELEVAREERTRWMRSFDRAVQESGECLLVVNQKGNICGSSHSARLLLSMDPKSTEEARLEDLFSPAAQASVSAWRKQIVGRHGAPSFDGRLASGAFVRVHVRSAAGPKTGEARCWLLWFENLDAPQARQCAESRNAAEMAALMQTIDSGVLLLDAQGNIRAVSERLGQIMGVESRLLAEVGTIDALIDSLAARFAQPEKTAARWRDRIEQADEPCWDEFELARPEHKVVERFARPVLASDGTRLGWLEVYRDITGQRLIQTNLLQTEKMAALGQLVSGIAHELNNPLTSIQGYAQLLGRRHGPNNRADARRIAEEAARAGAIVRNLLLFAREGRAERRPVDLNEIVERTTALRGYELKVENIRLELYLEPSLPQILGDAGQLQQVVLNLIVNSEQALEQSRGQGRIRIRTHRLAGDRIALEVSDDGPGVPSEIASRIFDPFFTTKPAGVGTGLGLSIVYGIVREHGGEVGVESEPGKGATLAVELPALTGAALAPASEESREKAATSAVVPAARPPRPAQSTRILVVEDEPTVAQLISDVLVEEGHSIEPVLDSRDALERMRRGDYGLVICDLKMPHLDGPALYRALVREANPLQRRLLFVTGDTMSPRTLDFLKASGLPYLAKPFLVEELKQAVRQSLGEALVDEEDVPGGKRPRTAVRRT